MKVRERLRKKTNSFKIFGFQGEHSEDDCFKHLLPCVWFERKLGFKAVLVNFKLLCLHK